jgi:hypothetical protein
MTCELHSNQERGDPNHQSVTEYDIPWMRGSKSILWCCNELSQPEVWQLLFDVIGGRRDTSADRMGVLRCVGEALGIGGSGSAKLVAGVSDGSVGGWDQLWIVR